MALHQSWYRVENAAAPTADIYVYDEIGAFGISASEFVSSLRTVTSKVINLHLNTPGGEVFDGIAIYTSLRNHAAAVNVFIEGLTASIGTVIAMAGDTITIAPHARMMIHDAWVVTAGNAGELTKMAERLEASSQNIASIYAERAGGEVDAWRALMRDETWYTDQEAVDAGLADAVGLSNDTKALAAAARFDLSRYTHGSKIAAMLREETAPPVWSYTTNTAGDVVVTTISGTTWTTPPSVSASGTVNNEPILPLKSVGRTMNAQNLEAMHGALTALLSLHEATCDMGEECPHNIKVSAREEREERNDEPVSPIDARRKRVDELLAGN